MCWSDFAELANPICSIKIYRRRFTKKEITAEHILYINFEDERLLGMQTEKLDNLLEAYRELYPDKQPLIYLDEIQNVVGWEKFARRLADSKYRVMI